MDVNSDVNNTTEKDDDCVQVIEDSNDAPVEGENKKPDCDEEDVPGDFFDDFLKEDFMAGLDIVDEDDGEEDKQKKEKPTDRSIQQKAQKVTKKKKDSAGMPPNVSKEKTKVKTGKVLKKSKQDDELKKLDAELNRIKNTNFKKQKQKSEIDVDEFDIRRDPEKTRRDIQRDKERCEKDREKKILEEKLGLVETGLVPPGMEMEVDLEEIKRQERIERNKPPVDLRNRIRSLRSRSRGRDKPEEKPHDNPLRGKRTSSPKAKDEKPPARSPVRVLERREVFRRRRPSPEKDAPKTSLTRTSPRRRSRSPRRRSPWKRSPWRRSRSPQPYRRPAERGVSPNQARRRRDRSFSPADRRRRSRSREGRPLRREEKRSFLEELVEKLNEPRKELPQQYIPMQLPAVMPQPYFQPQPVAPPPQVNSYDPYDASFFIGNSAPQPSGFGAEQNNQGGQPVQDQVTSKEEISKLFQDKKIRLTEFLAITKKPEEPAPTPAKLKEKIRVLQRCQEALRVLESMESAFSGRLVVRKTEGEAAPPADKTRSPLLRFPEVKLPFTTPGADDREVGFTRRCRQLLKAIGVHDAFAVTDEEICSARPPAGAAPAPAAPAPAAAYTHQKTTQTDPKLQECRECRARDRVERFSLGVQCGAPKVTFSVSTQVGEADFYATIPKTQSLATLTPAQLLGRPAAGGAGAQTKLVSQGSLVKSLESFLAMRPAAEAYGGAAPPPPPAPPSLLDLPFGQKAPAQYPGHYQNGPPHGQPMNRYGGYGRF